MDAVDRIETFEVDRITTIAVDRIETVEVDRIETVAVDRIESPNQTSRLNWTKWAQGDGGDQVLKDRDVGSSSVHRQEPEAE